MFFACTTGEEARQNTVVFRGGIPALFLYRQMLQDGGLIRSLTSGDEQNGHPPAAAPFSKVEVALTPSLYRHHVPDGLNVARNADETVKIAM